MGISAGNKKMVGGHFISDIIDSDVLKILLGTREVFSAYVFVWKTKTFSYTGADQVFEVPEDCNMTIECWGAGSNNASGGYAKGVIPVTKGQKLSFMIGGNGGRTNDGTTYGFGGSTTYGGRGGGGLSGVFTGDTAIGANDASRVLVIAGGAGGGRTGGGAGGGETGQNGNGGSYGYPGAGGTQTGRGNGGNTRSEQFRGGGGSGTYGFGGGGGWRGGNGSGGDGSGDDDAQAGGGSGHVINTATDIVLTQGGGSSAGQDGSVKIRYLVKERPQPTPKARLPHEYQEVEYIEGNGTQRMDLLTTPTSNTKVQFKFMPKGWTGWTALGYYTGNDNTDWRFFTSYGSTSAIYTDHPGRPVFDFNSSRLEGPDNTFALNTVYELEMGNYYLKYLDGANILTGNQISGFTGTTTIKLDYSYSVATQASNRWYYVKIWDGDVLVKDFVPCYRVSDGTIGLYDLVEGKFYTNSGTGTFIKGVSVNAWQMPNGYTELVYIQSTGTQYIDTGYNTTNDIKIEAEAMFTRKYDSNVLFGTTLNSWSYGDCLCYLSAQGGFQAGAYNTDVKWTNGDANINYVVNYTLSSVTLNGDTKTYSVSAKGNRLTIMAGNTNHSELKLYYFKIYSGVNLVRDFVPCIRDSDGVIGMYDLVTKQFFASSGTGDFVAGPIVMRDGFKLSQNTIAHLLLDGNTDYEGSGITGTNPGSDITYETVSGETQAIRFKGNTDSFLGLIGVPEMNTDFTIGFWIKQYNAGTAQIFVERGTSDNTNCDLHYIMRATNKIDLGFYANDCAGNTAISASTWYHLCATYKYSTREMKTYINAVADGTLTGSGDPAFGSGPLYLGCKKSYASNSPSNAAMSDFFRENKVWSQEQIQQYVRGIEGKYR